MHVIDHLIRITGATGWCSPAASRSTPRQHAAARAFRRKPISGATRARRAACISGCRRRRTMPASPWARPIWAPISPVTRSGPALEHAFYCGSGPPTGCDIRAALGRRQPWMWMDLRCRLAARPARRIRRPHGLHDGAGRRVRARSRAPPRPARARSAIARSWPIACNPKTREKSQRPREISRSDPAAGADDDARGGDSSFSNCRTAPATPTTMPTTTWC